MRTHESIYLNAYKCCQNQQSFVILVEGWSNIVQICQHLVNVNLMYILHGIDRRPQEKKLYARS